MSLVKPEEEIQTTKLIQGHKGKSPITPMMTKNVESFRSNDEEPTHEEEEIHIDTKALVVEETTTESRLNAFVSSYPSSGVKEPANPRERGYNLQPQQDVLEGDQSLVLKHIRGSKHQPDFTPTASPSNSPAFKINLMKDLRLVQGLQILVFEPGGTTYGSKKVNNNLITKVAALHSPFIYKELDLRSNPFKGGGNGAILDRLYVINHQLSSEEEYPEELSKVTACLGAWNKENGCKLELSNEEASDWARKKRQRQTKPKHSRGRLWTKKKRQRAYGKAHESDGSKEESKAREARPPDGPNEANNLCMDYSPTRSLLRLDSIRVG